MILGWPPSKNVSGDPDFNIKKGDNSNIKREITPI
jgi:hypothetical protein